MRSTLIAAAALASCGPALHPPSPPDGRATAFLIGGGSQRDTADTACNVVLQEVHRAAAAGDGGVAADCSSGSCWAILDGTVDISAEAVLENLPVRIWYQGTSGGWQSADTAPAPVAGEGFRRYAFHLAQNTFTPGAGPQIVDLIPYLQTPAGGRVFDHNRLADPAASYEVGPAGSWTVQPGGSVCPEPQPRGQAELDFPASWQNAQHGALVDSGKLTIAYDPNRLPQCLGSNYNGFPTWSTIAFVQFDGAAPLQYPVPTYQTGAAWASWPIEIDVPAGASDLAVWFLQTGEDCAGPFWDSNYGRNYVYPVASQPPAAVGWAGNWGGSFDGSCAHQDGLAEPLDLGPTQLAGGCLFVDAEIWIPGLTDQPALHPELVRAQVISSLDGAAPVGAWLSFVGQVGNNYRYRWTLDPAALGASWSVDRYHFTFSTDGEALFQIGEQSGPAGGPDRTLVRVP